MHLERRKRWYFQEVQAGYPGKEGGGLKPVHSLLVFYLPFSLQEISLASLHHSVLHLPLQCFFPFSSLLKLPCWSLKMIRCCGSNRPIIETERDIVLKRERCALCSGTGKMRCRACIGKGVIYGTSRPLRLGNTDVGANERMIYDASTGLSRAVEVRFACSHLYVCHLRCVVGLTIGGGTTIQ